MFYRWSSVSLLNSDKGSKVFDGSECDIVACFDHDPAHHKERWWVTSQLHLTIRTVVLFVSLSLFPRCSVDLLFFVVHSFKMVSIHP